MSFSKKTRYGLTSLIDLAVNSKEGPVSLGSIAKRNGISQQFLEQIFSAFRGAKLVRSVKGPQGGYQLAKSADEVTVADVLQALEGTYHLEDQVAQPNSEYMGIADTIQRLVIDRVNHELDAVLENLTISQLELYYSEHYDQQEMYYI